MEAIKCPNCGSEKVQELTEEKYVCLACDNVFLVHNLSKEFRQTDAHISDVHADISKKIDNLSTKMQNGRSEAGGAASKAKMVLREAEDLLKKGVFLGAYEKFRTYAEYIPDSYIGYEGMFRSLTDSYMDDAGQYKRITSDMTATTVKNLLADGTDVLSKALQCEDCNKEDLLNNYKKYYEKSLKTLQARIMYNANPNDVEGNWNLDENKEGEINNIRALIAQGESGIEQINARIVENKERVEDSQKRVDAFNALSEAERKDLMKKSRIRSGIAFGVTLILAVLMWGHVGLFLHIIEVVVVLFVGFLCVCFTAEPSIYEGKESELEQELARQKDELQVLQEKLSVAQENKEDRVDTDELENFILTNNSNAKSAEELYEKYSELEKPKEKTGYDVFWTKYTGIRYANIMWTYICEHGGYKVHKTDVPSLPEIVLTKATKSKSDILLHVGVENQKMKFLREISDDSMYTLLLMPESSDEWHNVWNVYEEMMEEIAGKRIFPDRENIRVFARSADKEKLMDCAERLTDIGIKVKVI